MYNVSFLFRCFKLLEDVRWFEHFKDVRTFGRRVNARCANGACCGPVQISVAVRTPPLGLCGGSRRLLVANQYIKNIWINIYIYL